MAVSSRGLSFLHELARGLEAILSETESEAERLVHECNRGLFIDPHTVDMAGVDTDHDPRDIDCDPFRHRIWPKHWPCKYWAPYCRHCMRLGPLLPLRVFGPPFGS